MADAPPPFPELLSRARGWQGGGVFQRELRRRDTYQLVLPLALLGTLVPLTLPGQSLSVFASFMVPFQVALVSVTLTLSLTRRCPVWALDLLLLLGGWLSVLGQMGLALFMPDMPDRAATLGTTLPWFLVLLLAQNWLLGARRGQALGLAALGVTLALTLAFAVGPMAGWGEPGQALLSPLLQLLLAGGITLLGQHAATRRASSWARQGLWSGIPDHARDPLTGLPGRWALEHVVTTQLPQKAEGLAVAVLRIDGLEEVASQRGAVFAEVLRAHVARTLSASVRDEDVVGCLEDGEFAVLMRVPNHWFARATCERLRVRVASRPLSGLLPTISIGVAFWNEHPDMESLLQEARQGLNCAQTDGGNRVHLCAEPSIALAPPSVA